MWEIWPVFAQMQVRVEPLSGLHESKGEKGQAKSCFARLLASEFRLRLSGLNGMASVEWGLPPTSSAFIFPSTHPAGRAVGD
jgi:hypothetical protein